MMGLAVRLGKLLMPMAYQKDNEDTMAPYNFVYNLGYSKEYCHGFYAGFDNFADPANYTKTDEAKLGYEDGKECRSLLS